MKKLMFAAAVAATAGIAGAIESANTVGYTTQTVPNNTFAMVGVQFEGVGTSNGEIAINDFITGDIGGTDYDDADEFLDTATEIQVWGGYGYTFYYYLNAHDAYAQGWCDDWGDYTTDTLAAGTAVWYHDRTGGSTITTPGQVVTSAQPEVVVPNNTFMMAANFKPIELQLNDATQITFDGIVGTPYDDGDEFLDTATEIQVWGGYGYTFYYYLTAHDGNPAGWCDDWGDYLDPESATGIPAGRGFWAHARTGAFTISF